MSTLSEAVLVFQGNVNPKTHNKNQTQIVSKYAVITNNCRFYQGGYDLISCNKGEKNNDFDLTGIYWFTCECILTHRADLTSKQRGKR